MIKSKRFPACWLKFGIVAAAVLSAGCFSSDFSPTYKESDIPDTVKKICLEEYQLKVVPMRIGNTLWVYAPQPRLLHEEIGKDSSKFFDENIQERQRNIMTSISRVLVSSDKAPEFFVLAISDINIGLDYSLTANLTDLKKSFVGGLDMMEWNRRIVFNLEINPKAIGDNTGEHLKMYDVKMSDFLSRQITQRIMMLFQEERLKKYFSLKGANAGFKDSVLTLEYSLVQISEPKEKLNIQKDIRYTIAYCFKTYEFKDFSRVEIKDLLGQSSAVYQQKDIWAISIE